MRESREAKGTKMVSAKKSAASVKLIATGKGGKEGGSETK